MVEAEDETMKDGWSESGALMVFGLLFGGKSDRSGANVMLDQSLLSETYGR
jgi:hypothetical protein